MDTLEEIMKKSTSKVINADFINEVTEVFNAEVNKRVLAEKEQIEKGFDALIETTKKTIELELQEKFQKSVDEEVEKIKEGKTKELEEELKVAIKKIEDSVNEKLDYAIGSFIEENRSKWEQEVDEAKVKSLHEDFKILAETYGVKLNTLNESVALTEANKKLDEAIEEINRLKKDNINSIRENIIESYKKDLTVVETDKFLKLVEELEFVDEESFKEKLDMFKVAIFKVDEMKHNDKDSTNEKEQVNENKVTDTTYVPSYKRK